MGRWEPNARGRLAQAALALYAEQGFEGTSAAQIAARAGLTERTFFRHFPDKREALFYGMGLARDLLATAVANAPADSTPAAAVSTALQRLCAELQADPALTRKRHEIVSGHAELRERELTKLAEFAAAMAGALRDRGVPEPAASLVAETGIAVFKVAFRRWLSGPGQPDLPATVRELMAELPGVLAVPADAGRR